MVTPLRNIIKSNLPKVWITLGMFPYFNYRLFATNVLGKSFRFNSKKRNPVECVAPASNFCTCTPKRRKIIRTVRKIRKRINRIRLSSEEEIPSMRQSDLKDCSRYFGETFLLAILLTFRYIL